jgi:hypothetical protein
MRRFTLESLPGSGFTIDLRDNQMGFERYQREAGIFRELPRILERKHPK